MDSYISHRILNILKKMYKAYNLVTVFIIRFFKLKNYGHIPIILLKDY